MTPRSACARLGAFAAAATTLLLTAPAALASHNQIALFQEPSLSPATAPGTLAELGRLGVGTIRVTVEWAAIAPDTYAAHPPRGFQATNPRDRHYNFSVLDPIVTDAAAKGIGVDLSLSGGAPDWATGRGKPRGSSYLEWRPDGAQFGRFVQAVAARYSGHFTPTGATTPLPRVSMWEIWNEPNFGPDLAPQAVAGSRVPSAAPLYRALVDGAWGGLTRTGHAGDTIVLGNLDARGQSGPPSRYAPEGLPGNFAATKPLLFIRELYCVGSDLRPLRGAAARADGCPTTNSGIRAFRRDHPGLFGARGFGDHPYPLTMPPTRSDDPSPDQADFHELPNMIRLLDGVERAYGSRHRFGLYNTEYGYITDPPNRSKHFASPALAAAYINEAEYLSYVNPRIVTTMQFLLRDPNPRFAPEYGGFSSGLEFYGGRHKPAYDAYRLPVWLPNPTIRRGRALLVWGDVRPAHRLGNPNVRIDFQAGGRGPFRALTSGHVTSPRGYFEIRVHPARSGVLRLTWTPPGGAPVHSRPVTVTVR